MIAIPNSDYERRRRDRPRFGEFSAGARLPEALLLLPPGDWLIIQV